MHDCGWRGRSHLPHTHRSLPTGPPSYELGSTKVVGLRGELDELRDALMRLGREADLLDPRDEVRRQLMSWLDVVDRAVDKLDELL